MNKFTYINHDTWIDERNNGIGASDIPILCGASDFATPLELWEIKTGSKKELEFDDATKKLLQAGKDQEPITLYRFLKNRNVKQDAAFFEYYHDRQQFNHDHPLFTEFHHPENKFMFCHPDLIYKDGDQYINIEAKYVKHKSDQWNFDDPTENGVPFRYYLQCQYQMMITGLDKTILCCNYLGADHYEFEFCANKKIFKTLEKLCFDFWHLVQTVQPPMPSNRQDVKKLFPNKNFSALTLPQDIAEDTILQKERYQFLKFRIKEMEKQKKKIATTIQALLSEYNVLQTPEGEQIASISEWKEDRIKALSKIKKENPEIYKYLKRKNVINEIVKSRFNF